MANRWGNSGNSGWLYFFGLQNHWRWWLQPWNSMMLTPWKKSYDQARQHIQKQRHYFANKGLSSQGYCFSSSHVWMWEWTIKLSAKELMILNCGIGEDSWESLGLQGDQSWIVIWRTDAEAETPIFWLPDAKSWLIGKDPDAGQDWRQEKETPESDMVAWHHQLDRHEFEQAPGFDDVQGSLVSCMNGVTKSWKQLSCWTELNSEAAKLLHLNLPIILFVLSHKEYHQFMNWFCYLEKILRFTF